MTTLERYMEGRDDINPATRTSILWLHAQDLATARAVTLALRDALVDVVETNPGGWEHFDNHCTPDTECCAGHVARVLRETAA
jgi:hypothetical protein